MTYTQKQIDEADFQYLFEHSRRGKISNPPRFEEKTIKIDGKFRTLKFPIESMRHKNKLISIGGKDIEIDEEIIPLVLWLNDIPGITTQFGCQGEYFPENDSEKPMIIFFCERKEMLEYLCEKLIKFTLNKSKGLFHCEYFSIKINVEWFEGKLRYIIKWFDLLAMKDFIIWLEDNKF